AGRLRQGRSFMALGFIKKMFSFGKKEEIQQDTPETVTPEIAPIEPASSAAEPTPSDPADHLPLERGDGVALEQQAGMSAEVATESVPTGDQAPTLPSPVGKELTDEAERGGVPAASSTAEVTPSGPADHLPLEGGEEPAPVAPVKVT